MLSVSLVLSVSAVLLMPWSAMFSTVHVLNGWLHHFARKKRVRTLYLGQVWLCCTACVMSRCCVSIRNVQKPAVLSYNLQRGAFFIKRGPKQTRNVSILGLPSPYHDPWNNYVYIHQKMQETKAKQGAHNAECSELEGHPVSDRRRLKLQCLCVC